MGNVELRCLDDIERVDHPCRMRLDGDPAVPSSFEEGSWKSKLEEGELENKSSPPQMRRRQLGPRQGAQAEVVRSTGGRLLRSSLV
jgi:hypothetical protein